MYGKGDDETDFYYPKYCPECGRRLKSDMDSIDEMYKNLRKCYECTIPQSCVGCPYNGTKRDILQYLEKQIGKEQNPE